MSVVPSANNSESTAAAKLTVLTDVDTKADAMRRVIGPFLLIWLIGTALTMLALWIMLRRSAPWNQRLARQRVLRLVRVVGLIGAGMPAATFVANLLPWWRWSTTTAVLTALLLVLVLLISSGLTVDRTRRAVELVGARADGRDVGAHGGDHRARPHHGVAPADQLDLRVAAAPRWPLLRDGQRRVRALRVGGAPALRGARARPAPPRCAAARGRRRARRRRPGPGRRRAARLGRRLRRADRARAGARDPAPRA